MFLLKKRSILLGDNVWSTKFWSIDKADEITWQSFTETTIDSKLVNKYLFTSLNAKPQKAYKIFVMDPR